MKFMVIFSSSQNRIVISIVNSLKALLSLRKKKIMKNHLGFYHADLTKILNDLHLYSFLIDKLSFTKVHNLM